MKFLNTLLILAIALTSFGIVQAQPTIRAYSVTNIQPETSAVTATVSVVKDKLSKGSEWTNGDVLRIITYGCAGTPAKGENGIVLIAPDGYKLLTSGGATCKATMIALVPPTK